MEGLASVISRLGEEFGELGETDIGTAIRLKGDRRRSDRRQHPLFQAALEQVRMVGDWKVPPTEVLIVLKFLSAVSRIVRRAGAGKT